MDGFLIEKFDRLMTWGQKRFGWNLALIRFSGWIMVGVLAILQPQQTTASFAFNAVVWTIMCLSEMNEFKKNRHYYENHRKVLALNAEVLAARENVGFLRYIQLGIFIGIMAAQIYSVFFAKESLFGIMTILCLSVLTMCQYVGTCFYMGPGEYASKKQELFHHNMSTSNT